MNRRSLILATLLLAGCTKVPAGYQGVMVNLYGSDKGVSDQLYGVGRYYLGWNSEMYLFPTFLQNYTWMDNSNDNQDIGNDESITMQTSEGLSINTDVGITYQIQPDNVVKVFQHYRLGVDEITNTFLRNMVRDAMNQVASTMTIDELYGLQKEKFIGEVNNLVKAQAANSGIDVDKVYLIGTFRLPQTVIDSINSKIQATQNAMRAENEVALAQAEAQKLLVTAAAQAKANQMIEASLTPEYVQYLGVTRWDGHLPKVTGSATPFVDIGNEKPN
jgi:regulator of protease activity HflC (stomatin/prohibitin superfamily)